MSRKSYDNRLHNRPNLTNYIDTIDALAKQARTSWLTLLTFLAFIGVTLLAVEDIDFFVPSRQTDLPLIGISIPTNRFFWVAPLLAAALYAQLHFLLLKLWEATAPSRAPNSGPDTPLSDRTNASFITDLALANRRDGALRPRPLALVTRWVTGLLIFAATPVILGLFWWRSMPAQDPYLTLIGCGLPFFAATIILLSSYTYMRRRQRDKPKMSSLWLIASGAGAIAILIAVTGVGSLRTYFSLPDYLADLTLPDGSKRFSEDRTEPWWPYVPPLASADLRNANLVQTPPDWPTYNAMRTQFTHDWCSARDIPLLACDSGENTAVQAAFQAEWCADHPEAREESDDCPSTFARLFETSETDWQSHYNARVSALPSVNLSERSLQGADLAGAQLQGGNLVGVLLQGANLVGAQLQRAELVRAELQGANLIRAQLQEANFLGAQLQGAGLGRADLQGANLIDAELQGANLVRAQLQGANLIEAQLQGANLGRAQLHGANLIGVQLQGANLVRAQLQGASLVLAQFDDLTELSTVTLRGAALRSVDSTSMAQLEDRWQDIFADGSVTLPVGSTRPPHWHDDPLSFDDFEAEWREWQATLPEGWDKPDDELGPEFFEAWEALTNP